MTTAKLVSIQVGQIETYPSPEPGGSPWRSAIGKRAVERSVWAGRLGIMGDAQADRRNHGGEGRAINVYPSEHYTRWREKPGLEAMTGGAFGENFTTLGLLEDSVCIGDTYRVGEVLVEISQPRGPCYKLNRRWNMPDLQTLAEQEHRFGWYLRVREEGSLKAGQDLALLDRPCPDWTIARVWSLLMEEFHPDDAQALLEVPALSEDWKRQVRKKLAR